MAGFEKAPKFYTSIFEEDLANQVNQAVSAPKKKVEKKKKNSDYPAILELEEMFGRKLKHIDLQKIAITLQKQAGVYIERNTKRNKQLLLEWFAENWQLAKNLIEKHNLQAMKLDD